MRLNIRLHRVDTERAQAIIRMGEKRGHRLAIGDGQNIRGAIADEQSLGEGLISIQPAIRIHSANPGARHNTVNPVV